MISRSCGHFSRTLFVIFEMPDFFLGKTLKECILKKRYCSQPSTVI